MSDFPMCDQVVRDVTDYLEGALPQAKRIGFERHVAICPPCRAHFAQMRATLRTAGRVSAEDLDADAQARLVSAFREWIADRGDG